MPLPPLVTALAVTGLTPNQAELRARVLPDGRAASCWFEYGTTTNYGSHTSTSSVPSGNFAAFVTNMLGLSPLMTYYFRPIAADGFVTEIGGDMSFTTPAYVTTVAASQIQPTSALLNAIVRPGGLAIVCYFEYGTSTNYGSTSATRFLSQHVSTTNVGVAISGLLPATTYYFRATGSNVTGVFTGTNLSFTTPDYVTTLAATLIQATTARLNATVRPGGIDTTYYFEFGNTTNYGNALQRALFPPVLSPPTSAPKSAVYWCSRPITSVLWSPITPAL